LTPFKKTSHSNFIYFILIETALYLRSDGDDSSAGNAVALPWKSFQPVCAVSSGLKYLVLLDIGPFVVPSGSCNMNSVSRI
jgi:hypothetical protein